MRRGEYVPRRRKSKGILFVLLIVVAAIIYIYVSKVGVNLSFLNPSNATASSGQNTLVQTCNQKVTDCGSIIKSKYESSLSILKATEVNTTQAANQFLNTWGPASQIADINYYGVTFPVVMVATRLDNSDGTKTPHVFICKSDGTLESKSSAGLC